MAEPRPLSGITILAIEQLMALPFATQILADLGAEVIGVSSTTAGDDRGVSWRERTGRHKRQLCVTLNDPAGQALLRELAQQVDVVAENFRPGVMDRYGLGWRDLKDLNPRLIYASVSGYGHTDFLPSPFSELAAYGPIGEAMSGAMHAFRRQGAPGGAPFAVGDITTSIFAAIGILAALRHRDLTGRGQYVDVAMSDALLALAEVPFTRLMIAMDAGDAPPTPLPGYPIGVFSARDGEFFMVVLNSRHWEALCSLIDHREWLTDDRLADSAGRVAATKDVLVPAINAWAGALSRNEAIERCRAAGLAAAPVNTPADIAQDPHFAARKMIQEVIRPNGRPLKVVGSPIKLSGDQPPDGPVPIAGPGAHNREILVERFGIPADRYEQLVADGVVGRQD